MTGRDIPDADNVARYCSPRTVNEDNMPTLDAFKFRSGEEFLSVNWTELLVRSNVSEAVNMLRKILPDTGYNIKKNGRIVVLGVKAAKIAVSEVAGKPQIKHDPKQDNHSHSAIYIEMNRYTAAQALAMLSRHKPENVYPAII